MDKTQNDISVKIIVATHKKYQMPTDKIYLPLYVGAERGKHDGKNPLDLDYQKDNVGENISELNSSFCELTGLYWAWKNLDADYIGLVHYRRHFSIKRKKGFGNVLTYNELQPFLGKVKIFVPDKRRYYIESLYSHYAHTHYANQLDETRKVISEKYPDYIGSFDEVMKQTCGYMFNMMIMERKLLDEYCSWVFDILFELRKRIDTQELSVYQGKYCGRISEIIFNVWLEQKIRSNKLKRSDVMEIPYAYMEKVNWRKKGVAFLKAKFMGKKYKRSF